MNSAPQICEIQFEYTERFPEILGKLNCSLLLSTYQAGKVVVIGKQGETLVISFVDAVQPMGISVSTDQGIAVGTKNQIEFWKSVSQIGSSSGYECPPVTVTRQDLSQFDEVFAKRFCRPTGNIQIHEMAWLGDELWFANTRFSSLCVLQDGFSFVPKWQPPFVSKLDDRDRCHLNGIGPDDERIKFATVLAQSDSPTAWRNCKLDGGAVIDVPANETICARLCMPHSPRIYAGHHWVLNSGHGELGIVDPRGKFQSVQFMPGFLRGLAFHDNFAFVGLSRARETVTFGGLPVAEKCNELKCGVGIVDLQTGETVSVLKFNEGISEIFAVEVLPSCTNPFFADSIVDGNVPRELWMVPKPG